MTIEPFMVEGDILEFIEELKTFNNISLDDMPEYRLFISQIEEFFDKKLGKNEDDEDERKIISKTMIQNYIKDGLIMPPEGKSYNRNHIILLAFIYNLKPILSIKDIKRLLTPILNMADDESQNHKIEDIYNTYFDLKETCLEDFSSFLEYDMADMNDKLDERMLGECEKLAQILMVLKLITEANIRKRLAERLIELYFKPENE